MEEIWKDIPGYEGIYQCSNLGKIKSLQRLSKNNHGNILLKEKILSQHLTGGNYLTVGLYKNKKVKRLKIHQLVAISFLNHKINKSIYVVNHIDGNKSNNNLTNLEIITQRQNIIHGIKLRFKNNKSTGTYFDKNRNLFESRIKINNNNIFLGRFVNEKMASDIYKLAYNNINAYRNNNKEFREYLYDLI